MRDLKELEVIINDCLKSFRKGMPYKAKKNIIRWNEGRHMEYQIAIFIKRFIESKRYNLKPKVKSNLVIRVFDKLFSTPIDCELGDILTRVLSTYFGERPLIF